MLQYRQRIIDALIDRAGPDHSDDSAHEGSPLPSSDFHSGQALELRPRVAFLTDHRAQPIADGFAIRDQLRATPPILIGHMQQFAADDDEAYQHHAAQDAEE